MIKNILIINLEPPASILSMTSLLPLMVEKHGDVKITWITDSEYLDLLKNNSNIHKIFSWNSDSRLILEVIEFDIVLNMDKSERAAALLNKVIAIHKIGFGLDKHGELISFGSKENILKENVNNATKNSLEIVADALGIKYASRDYNVRFSIEEMAIQDQYRMRYNLKPEDKIVGLYTGKPINAPGKSLTLQEHIELISNLQKKVIGVKIILLGEEKDNAKNKKISDRFQDVISPIISENLKDTLLFSELCNLIISGDTLGVNIAISLKKYIVAWYSSKIPDYSDIINYKESFVLNADRTGEYYDSSIEQTCHPGLNLMLIAEHIAKFFKDRDIRISK